MCGTKHTRINDAIANRHDTMSQIFKLPGKSLLPLFVHHKPCLVVNQSMDFHPTLCTAIPGNRNAMTLQDFAPDVGDTCGQHNDLADAHCLQETLLHPREEPDHATHALH